MKKKIRVAVLMGGKSPEYVVSLSSGRGVVEKLSKNYEVVPIVVSQDGARWLLGEDGTVQGMLELVGVPYTGSGVLASALGMNKIASRKIWQEEDLPVVPYYIVRRKKDLLPASRKFKCPFILKPADQGSSVGISIIKSKKDFTKAWKEASQFGGEVIAEPYMDGMEVTCGVLGNDKPYALPPVEIVPVSDSFYSYKAKYEEGGSEHIIPPRLPKSAVKKIEDLAVRAFVSLGCSGFARIDMFVVGKKIYISEINTIPGLTPTSLFPDEAKAAGISYSQLLDMIIKYGLEKHGPQKG